MAKKFNELRRKMSPERRQRNAAETNRRLLEIDGCRSCVRASPI